MCLNECDREASTKEVKPHTGMYHWRRRRRRRKRRIKVIFEESRYNQIYIS
jgi:hypothetical protein